MQLGVCYIWLLTVYLIQFIMVCDSKCMELQMYMYKHIHIHNYMYKPDTYVSTVQCTKVFVNIVKKYFLW